MKNKVKLFVNVISIFAKNIKYKKVKFDYRTFQFRVTCQKNKLPLKVYCWMSLCVWILRRIEQSIVYKKLNSKKFSFL